MNIRLATRASLQPNSSPPNGTIGCIGRLTTKPWPRCIIAIGFIAVFLATAGPIRAQSPPEASQSRASVAVNPNGPSPIRGLNNAGFAKLKADWLRVSAGYRFRVIGSEHKDERTYQLIAAIVAEDPGNVATEMEIDKRTQPFWDNIRDNALGRLSAEESAKIPGLKQKIVEAYEETRAEEYTEEFADIFKSKGYDEKTSYEKADKAAKQLGRREALAIIGAAERMAISGQKFVASDTTTVKSDNARKIRLTLKKGSAAEIAAADKYKQLRLRQKDLAEDMMSLSRQLNGPVTAYAGINHVIGKLRGEASTIRENLPKDETLACIPVDRLSTASDRQTKVVAEGLIYNRENCLISLDPENPGVFVVAPLRQP